MVRAAQSRGKTRLPSAAADTFAQQLLAENKRLTEELAETRAALRELRMSTTALLDRLEDQRGRHADAMG